MMELLRPEPVAICVLLIKNIIVRLLCYTVTTGCNCNITQRDVLHLYDVTLFIESIEK